MTINNPESSDSTLGEKKMAKRGYRGKHPHNDMKVTNKVHGKSANTAKLTLEYNKTVSKKKYDYIKSHDGFAPTATGTITISGNVTNAKVITVVSTDGTSKAYTAAGSEDLTTDPPKFDRDASNANIALSIIDCVNNANGHAGKIVATSGGTAIVNLTQVEPGQDGNITITTDAASNVALTGFTGG